MFYGYVLLGVTRSLRDCCVANWQLFVNLACLSWTLMHQCDNSTIFFSRAITLQHVGGISNKLDLDHLQNHAASFLPHISPLLSKCSNNISD